MVSLNGTIRTSVITGVLVWLVCLGWFARAHLEMAAAALGSAFYASVLALLVAWLVREPVPEDRLRLSRNSGLLARWLLVAALLVVWGFVYGIAYGGVSPGGVHVPGLTRSIAELLRWQPMRGVNGPTLLNFLSLGLIPAVLLLATGARPDQIGFVSPIRGSMWPSGACLTLPAVFVVWAFASGRPNWPALGVILLHSFLSNAFPEEVQCRGIFLPALRAVLPLSWAVLIQGLLFGLFHLGGGISEEGGNYLLAMTGSVALDFPIGVALGIVAVRTGSLVLPIAIHVSLHVMQDLLR